MVVVWHQTKAENFNEGGSNRLVGKVLFPGRRKPEKIRETRFGTRRLIISKHNYKSGEIRRVGECLEIRNAAVEDMIYLSSYQWFLPERHNSLSHSRGVKARWLSHSRGVMDL